MWTDEPEALVELLRRVRLWPRRRPPSTVVDVTDVVMRALRLHREGRHREAALVVTDSRSDPVAVAAVAMGVSCALLDLVDSLGNPDEGARFLDALQLGVRETGRG